MPEQISNNEEQVAGETPPDTQAPATPPVLPVKEKYNKFVEEPVEYKESRVVLKSYQFPGQSERGGLPKGAKGSDNQPLLVPVPSSGNQQKLHRLAAKRLEELNKKWIADNPGVEELKVASGWRPKAFDSVSAYHTWCRKMGYWLPATYGPGPSSQTNTYKGGSKCTKKKAFNSPHETGLAIDFGNNTLEPRSKTDAIQKQSKAFLWLFKNAHLFGITPYIEEAWHWEIKVPLEAWITGEEFITGEDYAVRVKGTGNKGSLPPGLQGNLSSAVQCGVRGVVGATAKGPKVDLKTLKVIEPDLEGVGAGTEFPDHLTKPERQLDQVTRVIIHETAGGFGTAPSNAEGGDPKAVRTLIQRNLSTHFTITRTGKVKQHAKLTRVAHHGPGNPTSVGIDLVNPPGASETKTKKKWVNKSDKEGAYPILEKGFQRSGHLLNTMAQCEALYQLLKKLVNKLPNLKMVFPCATSSTGQFVSVRDPRVKGHPGVIAHIRKAHSDGAFAEWYCIARSKGISKTQAWFAAAGAASKRGENIDVPLPTTGNASMLASLGKEKLKEAREKYFEEKKHPK